MPEQGVEFEREYDKVQKSAEDIGASPAESKSMAARTQSGSGLGLATKDQLYNEAKRRGVKGRSRMTKRQLQKALGH